jgi:oxygen-dependent protoporphyrinogen oxidase
MNVIVLGGGLAGLTCAYRLKEKGVAVSLLESSKAIGGKLASRKVGGEYFDIGANTVLESNEAIRALIDDLGLREQILWASPLADARYIVKNGRLIRLPASPKEFLTTPLFSIGAKLRLLREPFIGKSEGEETIASFATRRFGKEILDYAVNPFLIGTYAAKPEDLSAKSAFKMLGEMESQYGSVLKGAIAKAKAKKAEGKSTTGSAKMFSGRMFSFEGGFYAVVQKLSAALGASIERGAEAQDIQRGENGWQVFYTQNNEMKSLEATHLVLATPAEASANLIESLDANLAINLKGIRYSPVAQAFLGFTREEVPQPRGYGFLVPEKEESGILGAVYNSAIFPSRYRATTFTIFIGGSRKPELAKLSDGSLLELATSELQARLNITAGPILESVMKWDKAIPQYRLGHEAILRRVAEFEAKEKTIRFVGNWRGGISAPDTVAQAEETAQGILQSLAS